MATQSRYGWELPDLPDAPNIPYDMLTLADDIADTIHNGVASGKVVAPAPAAVPGGGAVAVTFPAGRFTAAPVVTATMETATTDAGFAFVGGVTSTGVTVTWWQVNGTARTRQAHWMAVPVQSTTTRAAPRTTGTPVEVTCPTGGCGNQGHTITVHLEDPAIAVVCGVCGTELKAAG